MPTRVAAMLILGAALVGFLGGRQLLLRPSAQTEPPPPQPSATAVSPEPSASPSEGADHTVYEGPTKSVVPQTASSTCEGGDAAALLRVPVTDGWRCQGDAVGERLEFQFARSRTLVGVRIASGRIDEPDETADARQITSVRWRFSDGSWFDQGFSGRNAALEEAAFPEVQADSVTLEIFTTSSPTDTGDEDADAVTIGRVEFLTPG